MNTAKTITIDDLLAQELKAWLQKQEPVFAVGDRESSLLVCYSLLRELGGVNDELCRFISVNDKPIDARDLRGEIIDADGTYVLRISSRTFSRLSVVEPSLKELVVSFNGELLINPAEIASLICSRGLKPVIARDWLMRSTFSDFDPKKSSYRDQLWVLRNNEVLLYSKTCMT